MRNKFFFVVLFLTGSMLRGQGHPGANPSSPGKDPSVASEAELPVHKLKFEKADPVPGVEATHAWVSPVQCNADGAMFISFMKPYDPSAGPGALRNFFSYISVGARESHTFSPLTVPDLHDISVLSWFPSDSSVAFLLNATKESQLTPRSQTTATGGSTTVMVNRGKRHSYVAVFDKAGVYQQSVELPMDYQIYRFALLGSGKLAISGYDQPNDVARLLVLDSSGQVERPIQLPLSIQNIHAAEGLNRSEAMMVASKSFGSIQFTAYRDGILVWRAGHTDPVVEVSADGAVRELPIAYPKGFVLSDFVPSEKHLIVHLQPANVPEGASRDLNAYRYYEVDPGDGSLQRQLTFAGLSRATIACESGGNYLTFETDDNGKLTRLIAD